MARLITNYVRLKYHAKLFLWIKLTSCHSQPRWQDQESWSVSNMNILLRIYSEMWSRMITHDIQRFSNHLAAMYANLAKPTLDVILYNYQLSSNVGAEGVMGLTILVQLSATLCELYHFRRVIDISELWSVRYMTPPFGMYTALSAQMAGSLRHTHSRLVEFAEEVAFMRGEHTEKMLIEREYAASVAHENHVLQRRWWFGCVEEGIIKWLWGSFGVCCLQFVFRAFCDLCLLLAHPLRNSRVCQNSWRCAARPRWPHWRYLLLKIQLNSYQLTIQDLWQIVVFCCLLPASQIIVPYTSTNKGLSRRCFWTRHVFLQGSCRAGRIYSTRFSTPWYDEGHPWRQIPKGTGQ